MNILKKLKPAFAMSLISAMVFGLCACKKEPTPETTAPSTPQVTTEATAAPTNAATETTTEATTEETTEATEPVQMEGHDEIRSRLEPSGALGGIMFLGSAEEGTITEELLLSVEEQGYLEEFPFLTQIDEEHLVDAGGYELYCIVPQDPLATVAVCSWDYENEEEGELLYSSETGDPFFLLCNESDLMPNAALYIADSNGNSLEQYLPSLSLENGHVYLPGDPEGHLMDMSRYGDEAAYSFNLYLPDLDAGEVTKEYVQLDMIDEYVVLQYFAESGVIPSADCLNEFRFDGVDIDLDFDASFLEYLNLLEEEQTELLLVCMANSYIKAFDAESVCYYVDGEELATDYCDYSEIFEFIDDLPMA